MHVAVILRLGQAKAQDKLTPLLNAQSVQQVTVIRHARVNLQSEKLHQVVHQVGMDDSGTPAPWWAGFINVLAAFVRGLQVARREQPDIILGFNLAPYGVVAWAVALFTRKKCLVSLLGTDFDRTIHKPIIGSMLKWILRQVDGAIIYSEAAKQGLVELGIYPSRVFVLPNTINTDKFYPHDDPQIEVDLVYVGNLLPDKRVDLVLQTLAIIHRTLPDVTLRIIGDGPQYAPLQALAQELGIAHAVEFSGWSDQIAADLRHARILLLLSEHEGLPAVILEAHCTGLPVISTDVGAIRTVLRDGDNGYLFPVPTNPESVARRVIALLSQPELYQRMQQAALESRYIYGYEQATTTWEEIIGSI